MHESEATEELLTAALEWSSDHCNDVIRAIYRGDKTAARNVLRDAWQSLQSSGLDADQVQAIRYRLHYLACDIDSRLEPDTPLEDCYRKTDELLSEEPRGELSAATQRRLRFQLRCRAQGKGLPDPDCAEGAAELAALPEWAKDPELWHNVCTWAYSHKCGEIIEEALGDLTVSSQGFQSDFIWQRVYLMHLLLGNRATRRDVIELLKRIELPPHWRAVKDSVWPACVKVGLVDEEMQEILDSKLASMDELPPCVPQLDVATKRIRKDL